MMPALGRAQDNGGIKFALLVDEERWLEQKDGKPRHGSKVQIERAGGLMQGTFVRADNDGTWHIRTQPGARPEAVAKADRRKVEVAAAPFKGDIKLANLEPRDIFQDKQGKVMLLRSPEIHRQVIWNSWSPEVRYFGATLST